MTFSWKWRTWALPVTVPGDLVLLSQPGAVVGIGPICVYPVGFSFYLIVSLDAALTDSPELLFLGRSAHERDNMTRLLIRYGDGAAARTSENKITAGEDDLILRYCGEERQVNENLTRQESLWWGFTTPTPRPCRIPDLPTRRRAGEWPRPVQRDGDHPGRLPLRSPLARTRDP
jgi:hypothetical protein